MRNEIIMDGIYKQTNKQTNRDCWIYPCWFYRSFLHRSFRIGPIRGCKILSQSMFGNKVPSSEDKKERGQKLWHIFHCVESNIIHIYLNHQWRRPLLYCSFNTASDIISTFNIIRCSGKINIWFSRFVASTQSNFCGN